MSVERGEIFGYPRVVTKILVTIEDGLLARIDRRAAKRGISRSAYLAQLAADDLGVRDGPGSSARVQNALSRLDRLFAAAPRHSEDSTAAIRAERDAR